MLCGRWKFYLALVRIRVTTSLGNLLDSMGNNWPTFSEGLSDWDLWITSKNPCAWQCFRGALLVQKRCQSRLHEVFAGRWNTIVQGLTISNEWVTPSTCWQPSLLLRLLFPLPLIEKAERFLSVWWPWWQRFMMDKTELAKRMHRHLWRFFINFFRFYLKRRVRVERVVVHSSKLIERWTRVVSMIHVN